MSGRFAVASATVLIAVIVWAAEPATGQALCAGAREQPTGETRQQAADAVLCLLNAARTKRGLAPVKASAPLTQAAQSHSFDMVTRHYFAHRNARGEIVTQRAARAGYVSSKRQLGEVLAWGSSDFATPSELVKSLLAHAEHRRIVLSRRFRDAGVGLSLAAPVAGIGDAATLTVDFGRP